MNTETGKNVVVFGVDPQNDFGHPWGNLYCKAGFEIVGGGMILVQHAVYNLHRGWNFLFSKDWHPADSRHFKKWKPHCLQGTWGAGFLPGIIVDPYLTFAKGTVINEDGYDPFDGKNPNGQSPEQVMGNPDNTIIIVWGLATNFCVRAFVLTARKKGYTVYVALDACRPVPTPPNPPTDFITEEQAIADMKATGAIMTTVEEVVNGKV